MARPRPPTLRSLPPETERHPTTGALPCRWALVSGSGVTRDGAAAAASFAKACNATTALGCLGLGVLVRDGTGVPRDPARATALFKQACDGGVPAACKVLEGQK